MLLLTFVVTLVLSVSADDTVDELGVAKTIGVDIPELVTEDPLLTDFNTSIESWSDSELPSLAVRSGAYRIDNTLSGAGLPLASEATFVNQESEKQLLIPGDSTGTGTGTGTGVNNNDHIDGRVLPSTTYNNNGLPYVVTATRLAEVRARFLYWFYDQGGDENLGDYQKDIHTSSPQIHKNFNFQLPFFGFRFNYTRITVNGYLTFSDAPDHYTYPLVFPIKDWPRVADPSFIGIFFSKCRIGAMRPEDPDQRRPGVYFRMDRDLQARTDQLGVEMRERVMWDIREGVIGAESFVPKHAITVTWKNMSFAGGIDNSLYKTNSYQMVLATDEVFAYAIFNYVEINWSSHTEAGGDTTGGEGGVPAYIGFNAGNGTRSYEYKPYSQASVLRDLTSRGWANGFPGRHIFRLDENILLGTCNKDIDGANLPLMFAPESGNMLGGTVVNITGPCFELTDRVTCRFDTESVQGIVVDRNRAVCVQPAFYHNGYARLEVAINNFDFKWKGKFFVETPANAAEKIFFEDESVHQRYPSEIKISWNAYNLTVNQNANLRISIWGYKETTIRPQLEYIDIIAENIANTGTYTITPQNFINRRNPLHLDMEFGFLQINLTTPIEQGTVRLSPMLWSRPIPLAWYFAPQYEEAYRTNNWPVSLCNKWLKDDRFLKNFAAEVPMCPCTVEHAILDKGRFLPDVECNKDTNPTCRYNWGAIHCVRSGSPSAEGSGQQCCYGKNGLLMMSYDQMWGAGPYRSHDFGFLPYNEANKVPSLSNWFHDKLPFYKCCLWQEEQAVGCETFRFERRPSQDCVAYQSPGVAGIFGDPHIVTFDNVPYTFNGKGEYVLTRIDHSTLKLDVQGRFEQVSRNVYGEVNATQLTSVAMSSNKSAIIEVRLRPQHAQWRYRLDVFADGKRIYFDRPALRIQNFQGVTVYMPPYILNQSEIVVMFPSGAGIEVIENMGFMSARVYLPWTYINQTRGLFGNWSFDMNDDFVRPDGTIANLDLNDFRTADEQFCRYWQLTDREQTGVGAALFVREFGRTAAYYSDDSFVQNYIREPANFLTQNRTQDIQRANELCDNSYQCRYDYGMTLNRDMAEFTKNYFTSITNIKEQNSRRVVSCGILETPRFGRKSNFFFTPGTKVSFECNQNFILVGDKRRTCEDDGKWNIPEYGYTECLRQQEYSQRTLLVTGAVILGVIVPLALLMCLLWFWCVHKPKEEGRQGWRFEDFPRSKSLSRLNLRTASMGNLTDTLKTPLTEEKHMLGESEPVATTPITATLVARAAPPVPTQEEQEAVNSEQDSPDLSKTDKSDGNTHKRRMYAKTYRTHEPLPNAPDVDFPEKPWDLSEEDILSLTSGSDKGSSVTTPAKEIEYINKPRQLGRRAMAAAAQSDSGYSTSVKAEDPNPSFQPQSPSSSHYSPSYSELYTPPVSPTSDQGSILSRRDSPKRNEPLTPIKTYTTELAPGRSIETLIDPPDPNTTGIIQVPEQIETMSGRTTMV